MEDQNPSTPISSATIYQLSQDELNNLKILAEEQQDSAAAFRLYQYYTFSKIDEDNEMKFLEIAARNGHNVAQHNLAYIYFMHNNLDAAYKWAQEAKSGGNRSANELLRDIKAAQKKGNDKIF